MSVPPPPAGTAIPGIPPIPAIPAIPPIPAIPRRTEPDPAPAASDAGDVDQATISRVPIEITDNASPTSVNYDLPEEVVAASASDSAADASRGAAESSDAPAHLRATTSFNVPDTSPTEPVESFEARGGHTTDPNGEAVTVPARSRHPAPTTPPRERLPKLPLSTAPDSLPPPKDNKQQASGPSPACPQCESPMAWVEEHLRFYCKSCRMYF
jgi:hypothetical protein